MGVLRAIGVLIVSILLTLGVVATDAVYYVKRANLLESYPPLAELGVVEPLSFALPGFVALMILLLYLGTRSVRTVARGLGMSLLVVGAPPVVLEFVATEVFAGRSASDLLAEFPEMVANLVVVFRELPAHLVEPLVAQSLALTAAGLTLVGVWVALALQGTLASGDSGSEEGSGI